jgi:protein XagA
LKPLFFTFAAALLIVAALTSNSFAGAWTQPKGVFYEKFAYNYYYADHTFDSSGDRIKTPNKGRFSDNNLRIILR